MIDRKEIKAKAKAFAFKNKWAIWKPILVNMLICGVIGGIIGLIVGLLGQDPNSKLYQGLQTLLELLTLPMSIGCTAYVMKLLKGKNMTVKEALFSKYSFFGLILSVSIVVSVFTALWSILLIIPGIIYAYKMAMVNYILAEDDIDKLTYREVMESSEKLTDGHKMDLFVFNLSFFGWILLSVVTLGIGLIWTLPYIEVANIMYYDELKKVAK